MKKYKVPLHKKIKYTLHKYTPRRLLLRLKQWNASRWQYRLFKKYPTLFKQTSLGKHESCMYWGIETGAGWSKLIDDMSNELSHKFPHAEYAQIKEKFGILRVYIDNVSADQRDKLNSIIERYEVLSSETCEVCGLKATRTQNDIGWISVTCNKCK